MTLNSGDRLDVIYALWFSGHMLSDYNMLKNRMDTIAWYFCCDWATTYTYTYVTAIKNINYIFCTIIILEDIIIDIDFIVQIK
jgi:hypothetical protein